MNADDNSTVNRNKKKYYIIATVIIIVLLIEIAAVLMTYFFMNMNDKSRISRTLQETNKKIIKIIDNRIQTIKYTIERNAILFSINGIYLTNQQYINFININVSPTRDIVETYIFIPKITPENFNNFTNFCRQYINANCTIKKFNDTKLPDLELIPIENNRTVYYPLIYSEPDFNKLENQTILGFDLFSNNITQIVVNSMLSVPDFSAAFRLRLVTKPEENPFSYGVLLNYPAFIDFDNKITDNIYGFSSGVIKIGHLFRDAITDIDLRLDREDIDMLAFDITEDEFVTNITRNVSLLYKENKSQYKKIWSFIDVDIASAMSENYNIAGRKWVLYFIYAEDFKNKLENRLVIIIPCVIATISVLINIIIFVIYKFFVTLKQRASIEKNRTKIAVQMLAYVNHEIRNPLNVIKGLIEYTLDIMVQISNSFIHNNEDSRNISVVIKKRNFDMMISDLYTVMGSCNMMEHIVTDILDIQKLDSGKLEITNKNIRLDEFIKDLVKTISQKIDEKQSVKLEVSCELNMILYFDPYRMKQIMLNYLTNAIKYTNSGKIIISVGIIDDFFRFSVIDTGRGIADEFKYRIFQPFNLTNPDDASRYGGVGLGLYLCKMLAERMGGAVGFTSELGIGSTFWVDFPKKIMNPHNLDSEMEISINSSINNKNIL